MASNSEKSILLMKDLLQSNHKFAKDIYKIMAADEDEDLLFSPISLQIALLMMFSGAHGKTAEEMKTGLSLNKEKEDVLQGTQILLQQLKNPTLKIASKIFIAQQRGIKSTFKEIIEKYFESDFEALDFKESADQARNIINSWVCEKTEGKITQIIPPGLLCESTRLVLANAVHFKDDWFCKFDKKETFEEPFYSSKDNYVKIPMMHMSNENDFKYLEEESFKVLQIPFENRNFHLIIVLPKEIDGLRDVEGKLLETEFHQMFNKLRFHEIYLTLPKMKMMKTTNMNSILMKMGMNTMFDLSTADFSGIYADGEHNFRVSEVLHKAVFEMNEEGCEAAAVTGLR